MRLVQEEEFGPLNDGHGSKPGMRSRPQQLIFAHACQFMIQDRPHFADLFQKHNQRFLKIPGKFRIRLSRISPEDRRLFPTDRFETSKEYGLITGQMGDMLECAPFCGIDTLFQLLFGEVSDELADRPVLKFQTSPGG